MMHLYERSWTNHYLVESNKKCCCGISRCGSYASDMRQEDIFSIICLLSPPKIHCTVTNMHSFYWNNIFSFKYVSLIKYVFFPQYISRFRASVLNYECTKIWFLQIWLAWEVLLFLTICTIQWCVKRLNKLHEQFVGERMKFDWFIIYCW